MTTTITLTGRDRHRILEALWTVPELADDLTNVGVSASGDCDAQVDPRTLLAAFDLLATPTVKMFVASQGQIHITIRGQYRGIPMRIYTGLWGAADKDVARSFPEPSRAMLAALAGEPVVPVPSREQVRDALWTECDGPVPPRPLEMQIRGVYRQGGMLAAIREYRNSTRGSGFVASLAESKAWVQRVCADLAADTAEVNAR